MPSSFSAFKASSIVYQVTKPTHLSPSARTFQEMNPFFLDSTLLLQSSEAIKKSDTDAPSTSLLGYEPNSILHFDIPLFVFYILYTK